MENLSYQIEVLKSPVVALRQKKYVDQETGNANTVLYRVIRGSRILHVTTSLENGVVVKSFLIQDDYWMSAFQVEDVINTHDDIFLDFRKYELKYFYSCIEDLEISMRYTLMMFLLYYMWPTVFSVRSSFVGYEPLYDHGIRYTLLHAVNNIARKMGYKDAEDSLGHTLGATFLYHHSNTKLCSKEKEHYYYG